jgi:glycogen debranching enzyme
VNDFPKYSLPTVLQSSKDLDAVMEVIKNHVFPDLKLWEYKVIDVTAEKKKLVEALLGTKKPDSVYTAFEDTKIADLSLRERAVLIAEHGIGASQSGQRYGKTVELAVAVAFIKNLGGVSPDAKVSESEAHNLAEEYSKVLDEYNLPLYKEYDEDVRVALENTRNRIEYTRLADHGPKWGEVTKR